MTQCRLYAVLVIFTSLLGRRSVYLVCLGIMYNVEKVFNWCSSYYLGRGSIAVSSSYQVLCPWCSFWGQMWQIGTFQNVVQDIPLCISQLFQILNVCVTRQYLIFFTLLKFQFKIENGVFWIFCEIYQNISTRFI